jgi:hypothetical protein
VTQNAIFTVYKSRGGSMLSVADITSVIDEGQVKSELCELIKAKDDVSTGRRTCPKSAFPSQISHRLA